MRTLILIILLCSCKIKKNTVMICTKENAIMIADKELKRNRYKLEMLKKTVEETEKQFYIHYLPKEAHTLGNEAKIWISKEGCSIMDKKFYQ